MNSIDAMSELQALPRRLDAILAAAGISDGVATINGAPANASQLVYPGEEVKVRLDPKSQKSRYA